MRRLCRFVSVGFSHKLPINNMPKYVILSRGLFATGAPCMASWLLHCRLSAYTFFPVCLILLPPISCRPETPDFQISVRLHSLPLTFCSPIFPSLFFFRPPFCSSPFSFFSFRIPSSPVVLFFRSSHHLVSLSPLLSASLSSPPFCSIIVLSLSFSPVLHSCLQSIHPLSLMYFLSLTSLSIDSFPWRLCFLPSLPLFPFSVFFLSSPP